LLNVGDNVDHTHDLHVKTIAHDDHVDIGFHMLCPNTSLKGSPALRPSCAAQQNTKKPACLNEALPAPFSRRDRR
jgi:hypothetical protein